MPLPPLIDDAVYNATYWAAVTGFTLSWGFRAVGRRHLPAAGPALIVANHQSFLDPVLFGAAAPRRLTYLARSTLFDHPALAAVIRHFQAVAIDRGFGKDGLQTVLGELDRGRAVLVFPEGERTHTGDLQPLKPGVSLVLKKVTCPVVPAAVAGAFAAWPRQAKWPAPGPLPLPDAGRSIAVAFGRPLDPARFRTRDRDAVLTDLLAAIRSAWSAAEQVRRKPTA